VLAALQWGLQGNGCKVYTAASAEEGFRYLQAVHPQLLLIDFKLPGAPGTEFLKWAKKADPHVPAIMITGLSNQFEAIHSICWKLGAFACLQKPLRMDEVIQNIRQALGLA